jgi:hypothetical protein
VNGAVLAGPARSCPHDAWPLDVDHAGVWHHHELAHSDRGVDQPRPVLWVPITSSTSCDQVIFVDHATDVSLFSDAVQVEVDRLG